MLDQLVESKSNSEENKRRSEFLLVTLLIAVTVLVSAWTYSLFAKDYGMGAGDLELSTLVAPPPPAEEPEPEPEKQPEKKQAEPDVDVRKELIQNIMASPKVPEQISTVKSNVQQMRLDRAKSRELVPVEPLVVSRAEVVEQSRQRSKALRADALLRRVHVL